MKGFECQAKDKTSALSALPLPLPWGPGKDEVVPIPGSDGGAQFNGYETSDYLTPEVCAIPRGQSDTNGSERWACR